jgi:hypothetical protein
MIAEFVSAFMARKEDLRAQFAAEHPGSYKDIVHAVVTILTDPADDEYGRPDPTRIHQIDDGDYQGTLVFVIAASGYQPSDYWFVKVGYGSCSGCDTLEGIRSYDDNPPTAEQVEQYLTLALHIVQGLKAMQEDA